jgi:Na+-translocating ferredoxin:NAD+ oxidoreductase RnfG subunit
MLRLSKYISFLAFLALSSLFFSFSNSDNKILDQKVNKSLKDFYETEEINLKKALDLYDSNVGKIQLEKNLFEVYSGEELKGYAYIGQAPSMKNIFDYLVILDKDLKVAKAKVLIYREQHGRQIGSSRWLSQFIGLNGNQLPEFGSNIDGISGATISTKSMTLAMNELLQSLQIAKNNNLI